MTDAEKTEAILAVLKDNHRMDIWVTELAFSGGARRCDLWTLSPHRSKGYLARAYEIKVSRADWKRDHAIKQRQARLFSDEFYYVTPPGLIKKEEVPDWAGLIEIDFGPERPTTRFPVTAPHRDKDAPSWELVVAIMRYSGEARRDTQILQDRIRLLEQQNSRLMREPLPRVVERAPL